MKKLLYIPVNSKPEELSTSKKVGREFVNRFMQKNPDYELMELDLYNEFIPEINYKLFKRRAELVTGEEYEALTDNERKEVDRINQLCDQFLSADTYVIAAPMWSVMFPSRLKRYLDCIIQHNKVIKVDPEEVKGLLDDKERNMVYIQSSGGDFPIILGWKYNHGVNYCHDIFKFLGINKFEKILVEGVDDPKIGKEVAIEKAYKEMDNVINKISRQLVSSNR
ncbi:FMN-dependent NADH-azoreductase [Clostridium sediminicola]|uniref:FMN-dependent NADH-azoreductase n=1 Tax=Clostridium sediminicola TaxID=3114879 RepID=UPI0031F267D9